MSFEADFLELMPSTISVQDYTSFNQYGEPSYSTSTTSYRALIQEQPTEITDAFGRETIASHTIYVASTTRIDLTSKLILPDNSDPAIIRSEVFYDQDGIHHVVLFCGSEAGP